jgi:AhpD family alkylhydroperoxidase
VTRLPVSDLSQLPGEVRDFVARFPPDPIVGMLAHAAGTVRPFLTLAMAQFTELELSARSRELVTLAVAATTACAFVAAQHQPTAESAGVDERTRRLIDAGELDSPELSANDRALIRLVAAVVAGPVVPDEVIGPVREFLSDRELVEVLELCGFYWTFGRVCTVLEVPITQIYGLDDATGHRAAVSS